MFGLLLYVMLGSQDGAFGLAILELILVLWVVAVVLLLREDSRKQTP